MIKNKKISIFLIFFIIACVGCNDKVKRKYKKTFYSSGRIKSQGWYINDTIPVDTVRIFFEGGNILAKDIYDSIGNAVLSISYFENGKVHEHINYEYGLANGFFYKYLESGTLINKAFFVNDKQTGDTYYYNQSGSVKTYTFFDWGERPINLIKYDSLAEKIIQDMRQVIYIDTVNYSKNKLVNSSKSLIPFDIQIIVSNPPRCQSTVIINYISKNGSLIESDSMVNRPYYFKKDNIPDSLLRIDIVANQYDSIKKKNIFQRGTTYF